MLQQPSRPPQLGTADPLGAMGVHQVGGRAAGKTIGRGQGGRSGTEMKGLAQLLEGGLQPATRLGVGLPSPPGRIGPDQGVAEVATVQNGLATAGAAHQVDATGPSQAQPMGRQAALVPAHGKGGALPAIEPQGRLPLLQHPVVDGHLPAAAQAAAGEQAGG